MRVLFATTAGAGHFGPMVPVARACVEAGWEVAVAAPASFTDAVERAGLTCLPFGEPPGEALGQVFARAVTLPRFEADGVVMGEVFGRLDAQAALPGVTALMADWRPDLVLREPCEFSSLAVAAAAGVPQVQVGIGMARLGGSFVDAVREPLAELEALVGVDRGRAAALITGTGTLTAVPAALDASSDSFVGMVRPDSDPPGPAWRYRTETTATPRLPASWGDPDAPLVYVTFGTVAASLGHLGSFFRTTLEALADLPIRVLVTTGAGVGIDDLGTVPPNVHVEAWWPQAEAMSSCAAVVGHGGFGTTMTALAYGVPQVVVPLFASDQYVHAERVEAVGAGLRLEGGSSALPELAELLPRLLAEPAYEAGARTVADEMASLPELASLLPDLADLAAGSQGYLHRVPDRKSLR
jgi:hypothetical protein